MRPVQAKTRADIAAEWDRLALKRAAQIESGTDLSFTHILLPTVLSLASGCDSSTVLDVGCGPGFLTAEIARRAGHAIGVDISRKNIEYAVSRWRSVPNVTFHATGVEDYAACADTPRFNLAISNMTLMTVLDLDDVVKSVARLVLPGGFFVATITHPCFWPHYWEYADREWFNYSKEIAIESDFRISLDPMVGSATTHVHRPLGRYIAALSRANFLIEEFCEPLPTPVIERKYPAPWRFPRFLALRAVRK